MPKAKREEKVAEKDGDYEFKLPDFDEKAFIRREIQTARASFYTVGLGVVAGLLSVGLLALVPGQWGLGWIPIFGSMLALRPLLQRFGFPEEVTTWKALAGSFFMLFFTGLSVWILGANIV